MFEYGFKYFDRVSLVDEGFVVQKIKNQKKPVDIVTAFAFPYIFTAEEKVKVTLDPMISYPMKMVTKENLNVGLAHVYLGKELLGTVPLTTKYSKEASLLSKIKMVFSYILGQEGSL
jgi:D-alanyl-D-alanine carboxypeptidase